MTVVIINTIFNLFFQLKEEALRKELHTTRLALIKQVCNHNADTDRIDDIVSRVSKSLILARIYDDITKNLCIRLSIRRAHYRIL